MYKKQNPVDLHVGKQLRRYRILSNISKNKLSKKIGLASGQQIQKYETGIDRISAGRLYDIAQILETPIETFFNGLPGIERRPCAYEEIENTMLKRRSIELLQAYQQISNPQIRKSLYILIKKIAEI